MNIHVVSIGDRINIGSIAQINVKKATSGRVIFAIHAKKDTIIQRAEKPIIFNGQNTTMISHTKKSLFRE